MKKQLVTIIFVWLSIITCWTLANPPVAKLFADSTNNIGIATSTPMSDLDVNGTTTIRKSLNMTGTKIVNVATPVLGTDGVPMNYVSLYVDGVSSSTTRLWGEGRPGATVINAAGQCTNTVGGRTIKISKSSFAANWDKSAAACPANWWVCTAAERDTNGVAAGFGACPATGAVASIIIGCDPAYNQEVNANYDEIFVPNTVDGLPSGQIDIVWVADAADASIVPHRGKAVSAKTGGIKDNMMCIAAPVWCCSY